jgi:hypothetical protein
MDVWILSRYVWLLSWFLLLDAADSGIESNDSDEEFQICEICTTEEVVFLYFIFESLELFRCYARDVVVT